MKTATIRDIGPIHELRLPVPEDGGVVELLGQNGSGKTTALATIDKAVNDRGKLSVRDGAPNGEFEGLGVKLTLARSTRRLGELEVVGMESRFDVGVLVEPGVKEAEAADDKRIKALVALVGAKADPALFYTLVGGATEFDRLISPSAVTHTDLIKMAEAIKRDLEKASRTAEGEATNARARADAARKAAEGVDLDGPTDARELQQALEAAVEQRSKLEADAGAVQRKLVEADRAREAIKRAQAEYAGATVEQAVADEKAASDAEAEALKVVTAAQQAVLDAQERLRVAQEHRKLAFAELMRKRDAKVAAEDHVKFIARWQEQVDAGANATPINAGDIVRAKAQVDECRQQLEQAAIIRKAQASLDEATKQDQVRADHEREAVRLRDAARGAFDVLSQVISKAGVPLRVEYVNSQARLVLDTHRGKTLFAELSDGERWKVALDIAIQKIGDRGALVLGQEAWQGLDDENRRAVNRQAKSAGVLIFAARAANGQLRSQVFNGDTDGHVDA